MRLPAALAAASVLLLLQPVAAQVGGFLSTVRPGASDMDQTLAAAGSTVGFVDANNDFKVQGADPAEPVYLDINHDGVVDYNDIRLTPFRGMPAGSNVDVGDGDFGLHLATVQGWFATGADSWYLDADGSGAVSAGDVRLTGGLGGIVGTRVLADSGDVGQQLTAIQSRIGGGDRVALRDANGNGRYDVGETLYFDMDADYGAGARRVSVNDVAIAPSGFYAAPATRNSPLAGVGADAPLRTDSWRGLDWAIVGLAVANLAGLAFVARQQRRPRNPFQ